MAQTAGIPARTLERVKVTVGVKSDAVSTGGKIEWWWRDPKADRAAFDEIADIERTLMGSLARQRADRAGHHTRPRPTMMTPRRGE